MSNASIHHATYVKWRVIQGGSRDENQRRPSSTLYARYLLRACGALPNCLAIILDLHQQKFKPNAGLEPATFRLQQYWQLQLAVC